MSTKPLTNQPQVVRVCVCPKPQSLVEKNSPHRRPRSVFDKSSTLEVCNFSPTTPIASNSRSSPIAHRHQQNVFVCILATILGFSSTSMNRVSPAQLGSQSQPARSYILGFLRDEESGVLRMESLVLRFLLLMQTASRIHSAPLRHTTWIARASSS